MKRNPLRWKQMGKAAGLRYKRRGIVNVVLATRIVRALVLRFAPIMEKFTMTEAQAQFRYRKKEMR